MSMNTKDGGSWMEMEAAEEEAFFVNILVTEEEEMEDLEFIMKEEEESMR